MSDAFGWLSNLFGGGGAAGGVSNAVNWSPNLSPAGEFAPSGFDDLAAASTAATGGGAGVAYPGGWAGGASAAFPGGAPGAGGGAGSALAKLGQAAAGKGPGDVNKSTAAPLGPAAQSGVGGGRNAPNLSELVSILQKRNQALFPAGSVAQPPGVQRTTGGLLGF